MPKKETAGGASGDWRTTLLSRIRTAIVETDSEMVEEQKWAKASNPDGVPVWSHGGMVCTGEIYKTHVKVTFAKGASLEDPSKQFNSSLDGGTRRAIDWQEGDTFNERAFKALIKAAVALNLNAKRK